MKRFDNEKLKAMRVAAGMSRSALTRRLMLKDVSAAEGSILQWERERMPALPTFLAICAEIGPPEIRAAASVLMDYFMGEVEVPVTE